MFDVSSKDKSAVKCHGEGKKYQDKVKLKTSTSSLFFSPYPFETVKGAKKSLTILSSVIININVTEAGMLWIMKTANAQFETVLWWLKKTHVVFSQIVKLEDLFVWGKQNVAILPAVVLLHTWIIHLSKLNLA